MKPLAFVGAAIGALIGAGIWGAIAAATHTEYGIIAWLIGGLVGFGAVICGGEGAEMGMICGLIALGSMMAGKVFALQMIVDKELNFDSEYAALYEEIKADAVKFAELTDESQYPQFMVDYKYTMSDNPQDITPDEIQLFINENVPELRRFNAAPPTLDEWKEARGLTISTATLWEVVKADLNFLDFIFGLFGLMTAYRVVAGKDD